MIASKLPDREAKGLEILVGLCQNIENFHVLVLLEQIVIGFSVVLLKSLQAILLRDRHRTGKTWEGNTKSEAEISHLWKKA